MPKHIFSRYHYIWLASAMRDLMCYENARSKELEQLGRNEAAQQRLSTTITAIGNFATCLQEENPNFDRKLFMRNVHGTEASEASGRRVSRTEDPIPHSTKEAK